MVDSHFTQVPDIQNSILLNKHHIYIIHTNNNIVRKP